MTLFVNLYCYWNCLAQQMLDQSINRIVSTYRPRLSRVLTLNLVAISFESKDRVTVSSYACKCLRELVDNFYSSLNLFGMLHREYLEL